MAVERGRTSCQAWRGWPAYSSCSSEHTMSLMRRCSRSTASWVTAEWNESSSTRSSGHLRPSMSSVLFVTPRTPCRRISRRSGQPDATAWAVRSVSRMHPHASSVRRLWQPNAICAIAASVMPLHSASARLSRFGQPAPMPWTPESVISGHSEMSRYVRLLRPRPVASGRNVLSVTLTSPAMSRYCNDDITIAISIDWSVRLKQPRTESVESDEHLLTMAIRPGSLKLVQKERSSATRLRAATESARARRPLSVTTGRRESVRSTRLCAPSAEKMSSLRTLQRERLTLVRFSTPLHKVRRPTLDTLVSCNCTWLSCLHAARALSDAPVSDVQPATLSVVRREQCCATAAIALSPTCSSPSRVSDSSSPQWRAISSMLRCVRAVQLEISSEISLRQPLSLTRFSKPWSVSARQLATESFSRLMQYCAIARSEMSEMLQPPRSSSTSPEPARRPSRTPLSCHQGEARTEADVSSNKRFVLIDNVAIEDVRQCWGRIGTRTIHVQGTEKKHIH
eukprot:m.39878 g.39878  ORF g.39878 m.39878 type:complete len:510 (-) comp5583_c0_seq1:18-1547(-)